MKSRYSAKLLFEFRVSVDGNPGIRRLCEERIILVEAASARDALREARREGRTSQYRYRNNLGDPVHFRFVGVMDLLHLEVCSANEVWYTITQRVRPFERRRTLLPAPRDLAAMRQERMRAVRPRAK
jgi:hypothetical protein